jgi:hypothetical protein
VYFAAAMDHFSLPILNVQAAVLEPASIVA